MEIFWKIIQFEEIWKSVLQICRIFLFYSNWRHKNVWWLNIAASRIFIIWSIVRFHLSWYNSNLYFNNSMPNLIAQTHRHTHTFIIWIDNVTMVTISLFRELYIYISKWTFNGCKIIKWLTNWIVCDVIYGNFLENNHIRLWKMFY